MEKIIITEKQHKLITELRKKKQFFDYYFSDSIIEDTQLSVFDIEFLKSIKTFKGRIAYCEKLLKRIGVGGSRIVYELDGDRVLKLASNKKGLAQCEGEVETANYENELLTKLYDYDEIDGYVVFVIMEKVKPAKVEDFRRIVNIDFKKVFQNAEYKALEYAAERNDYRNQHKYFIKYLLGYARINKNPKFFDLAKDIEKYILDNDIVLFGDVSRIVNWGVSKDRLVLLDYGLNDSVYQKHYMEEGL